MSRRTAILALSGTAAILAGAATFAVVMWWPSSPTAAVICARCGYRFEATGDQYRAMPSDGAGLAVRCPKCLKISAEPVVAVCPHCRKAIRDADLDRASPGYARRLCPHCGKQVPP